MNIALQSRTIASVYSIVMCAGCQLVFPGYVKRAKPEMVGLMVNIGVRKSPIDRERLFPLTDCLNIRPSKRLFVFPWISNPVSCADNRDRIDQRYRRIWFIFPHLSRTEHNSYPCAKFDGWGHSVVFKFDVHHWRYSRCHGGFEVALHGRHISSQLSLGRIVGIRKRIPHYLPLLESKEAVGAGNHDKTNVKQESQPVQERMAPKQYLKRIGFALFLVSLVLAVVGCGMIALLPQLATLRGFVVQGIAGVVLIVTALILIHLGLRLVYDDQSVNKSNIVHDRSPICDSTAGPTRKVPPALVFVPSL
jgi:hypothetical protein